MDVRLPDGTIIQNVPDGTTKADLTARLARNGYDVSKLGGAAPAAPDMPASPAQEMGMGEAALVAAGRGVDKTVKGLEQLYRASIGDKAGLARMAGEESENDRLYKPLQEKYPTTTALGEQAQMLAIPMGGPANLILKAAAAGAAPGLIGYGDTAERYKRGAIGALGGAAGGAAGLVVSRLLKPAGVGAGAVADEAAQAAGNLGVQLTPGMRTQNAAMQNIENYLARSPGSSGRMQAVQQGNQTALNRAAARAMGEVSDTLDSPVFGAAKDRIGSEFGRLSEKTAPQLGDDFVNVLASIEAKNAAKGPFASKSVTSVIDKGLDLAAKGDLSGKAYKEIRTELANQAQTAFKSGDAATGQAYKELYTALDKAAKSSLSEADQKAWDVARQQWSAFKTLSKGNVAEGGNVSAARAASAVRNANPNFRTGGMTGDLADIARFGESFKSVANPNSGNLTQGMLYGNPFTGVPLLLGNKAAAAAYMSPLGQSYLGNGLLNVSPAGLRLLTLGGATGGVPGLTGLLGVE